MTSEATIAHQGQKAISCGDSSEADPIYGFEFSGMNNSIVSRRQDVREDSC